MGSKKHKKESKKKKHRSRSRSPLENEERERKRHKKHKDRKKDRSPDVEEVPVDSHLGKDSSSGNGSARAHSRSRSEERDRRMREERYREKSEEREEKSRDERSRDESVEKQHVERAEKSRGERMETSPVLEPSGGAQESLSIEETNRLRVKLGLKPLEVNEKPAEDGKIKDDLGEFYHKPATNIAHQQKTEKLKQKLEERKEKRNIEKKLKTATLGEGSDDDDAAAWVQRSREIDKQKREAAKRAAMLDEMDEVFGVSALAGAGAAPPAPAYTPRHLKGLRVAHQIDQLADEQETILTLADKDVLAEDGEDVLVNVNMLDDERYKKSIEDRKKARAGYQAYDDEAELEAAALGFHKPVLAKYDEHIHPEHQGKEKGFVIGDEAAIEAKRFRDRMRRSLLEGGPDKRLESLALPAPRLASDYLDEHEMEAKFKKSKRKGKIRKKPKAEPIDVDDYDAGNAPLDTDDTDVKTEQLVRDDDEDDTEPDTELQAALARARRLRQRTQHALPKVEEILERVKEESPPAAEAGEAGAGMVLDATAEFCRTLGDIPTYGQAGNRDHHAEILELEPPSPGRSPSPPAEAGAWARVEPAGEEGAPPAAAAAVCLEPRLGAGVAGALALALSKGYLERAGGGPAPRAPRAPHLLASRYSIEDKAAGGEDERRRPEREHRAQGPLHDFREKPGFRPDVKLEYVDDDGRPLAPKEAFRYLSHKFHGKGPGKNKQEKRIKKAVQEGLMKKMSSTDTPLNTLQMLQDKQRETRSPYIVLSGAKRDHPN